jgi:hypothetical protein
MDLVVNVIWVVLYQTIIYAFYDESDIDPQTVHQNAFLLVLQFPQNHWREMFFHATQRLGYR